MESNNNNTPYQSPLLAARRAYLDQKDILERNFNEEKPVKKVVKKRPVKKVKTPKPKVKVQKIKKEKKVKERISLAEALKKKIEPIKLKVIKARKAKSTIKKEKPKKIVKVRKLSTVQKVKIKKTAKTAGVLLALGLTGFLLYKSGLPQKYVGRAKELIETSIDQAKKVKEITNSISEISDTLLENNETENIPTEEETEPIEEVVEEEPVEYITAELFDAGYEFNKDITPEYLKAMNPSLSQSAAYIEIPGTQVSNIVAFPSASLLDNNEQAKREVEENGYDPDIYVNNYYLKHNYMDKSSEWGTLYVDTFNKPLNQHTSEIDDMSVIYGHHMKDGSMFTGLDKWKKDASGKYNEEHPFGVIYTDDGLCYKVTFITSRVISGDTYQDLMVGNFRTVEEKQAYIDEVIACAKKGGNFTLDSYEVNEDSKFVSLVTCSYARNNDRYVLIGVLEKQAIKDISIDGYEIATVKER